MARGSQTFTQERRNLGRSGVHYTQATTYRRNSDELSWFAEVGLIRAAGNALQRRFSLFCL